jgi:hypothetical protein
MILMIAATVSVAVVPAMKLGQPHTDGTPIVLVLNSKEQVATRINCLCNLWVNPEDSAAKLMASTKVAAKIIANDGKLTDLDALGPAKFGCVIMPGKDEKADAV